MVLEINPIGEVVAGRADVADGYWGGVESTIQLDTGFPLDAVQGLEGFSRLVVVWHFDQASPDDVEYHARSPRGKRKRAHLPTVSRQRATRSPADTSPPGGTCCSRCGRTSSSSAPT